MIKFALLSVCSIKLWEWHRTKRESHPGCSTRSCRPWPLHIQAHHFHHTQQIWLKSIFQKSAGTLTGAGRTEHQKGHEREELHLRAAAVSWTLRSTLSDICEQQKHQEVRSSVSFFWSCQTTSIHISSSKNQHNHFLHLLPQEMTKQARCKE